LNGRNYYPQDLESAVGDLPGVRRGNVVAFGNRAFAGREQVVIVVETRAPVAAAQAATLRGLVRGCGWRGGSRPRAGRSSGHRSGGATGVPSRLRGG
jgi:hypothetical protein